MVKGSEHTKCANCGKADMASKFSFWFDDKPFCCSACLSSYVEKTSKDK